MKRPVNDWWNHYVRPSDRPTGMQGFGFRQPPKVRAHKADCICPACHDKELLKELRAELREHRQ